MHGKIHHVWLVYYFVNARTRKSKHHIVCANSGNHHIIITIFIIASCNRTSATRHHTIIIIIILMLVKFFSSCMSASRATNKIQLISQLAFSVQTRSSFLGSIRHHRFAFGKPHTPPTHSTSTSASTSTDTYYLCWFFRTCFQNESTISLRSSVSGGAARSSKPFHRVAESVDRNLNGKNVYARA